MASLTKKIKAVPYSNTVHRTFDQTDEDVTMMDGVYRPHQPKREQCQFPWTGIENRLDTLTTLVEEMRNELKKLTENKGDLHQHFHYGQPEWGIGASPTQPHNTGDRVYCCNKNKVFST